MAEKLTYRQFLHSTGWGESRGTVLFLSSVKTEMTDTIEIGLKILPQHLHNQKYIVFTKALPPFCRRNSLALMGAADMCDRFECV